MNPFTGPIYVIKGFSLIRRPGLRRFVVLPLLINTLLFSGAIWLVGNYFDAFMNEVLPNGYDWLEWLLWPLFAVAMLLIMFYSFTLVANFICAPLNGYLAEAVEREITGTRQENTQPTTQLLKEIPLSFWSEAKKMGYFLLRAIPLVILFFIPGINIIAPFLWLAFSAWLLAMEYLDYPMANRNIQFSDQRKIIKQHRITTLSFGGSIMFLTMIPVVNFMVMPLAVAGATALYLEKLKK